MSKPDIIITRTQFGADALAHRLEGLGYNPVVLPLLEAQATGAPAPLEKPNGIIVTSAQIFRYLPSGFARAVPVHAVGDATAAAARAAGFEDVSASHGDVKALCADVRMQKPTGTWLYIGPEEPAAGTAEALSSIGCKIMNWAVYRTVPARYDNAALATYLEGHKPCYVLLHSAKAAAIFANAIQQYGPDARLSQIKVLCLSKAVLECLANIHFGGSYVAHTPDENALVTLLQTECQNVRTNDER
ncbi:MAG: uroporphyrinogen-III synthase [Alphaproteobacteria bacterium]|nr:uroporphyrinogen-III synthase [Alphaproteobacteria bacterium]